jgi:hypothetical protein
VSRLRQPNALDVFHGSIEVSRKRLKLLATIADETLRTALLEDALSAGVASFDALGKTLRRKHPNVLPERPRNLFQNLYALDDALQKAAGSPLSASFPSDDYMLLIRMFQVRHIYQHNAGVVDEHFCRNVPDTRSRRGRKYRLEPTEVSRFLELLRSLASAVTARLANPSAT